MPIKRITIISLALACLLAAGHLPAQNSVKDGSTSPTILVDSIVPSDYEELARSVKLLDGTSCGEPSRHPQRPTTTEDFVGGKVTTIHVVRSAPKRNTPEAREIRRSIRNVWQSKFLGASCGIDWSEFTVWSIESILVFEDGKQGVLITDGSHVALKDHDGKSWFFRLLPAAQ